MKTTLVALVAVLATASPALSQDGSGDESLATLSVWADETWISILDRDGARRGALAEAGVFQRFDPLEDHEYRMDVRTGLFQPRDDARWAGMRNGLRAAGVSISHPHIVHEIDWRQGVPVSGPVDVVARYRREHSLEAERDHLRLGVRWRNALGTGWEGEARIGAHFFKPSADVELALSRAWTGADGTGWEVGLAFAALDAFSETIFGGLGVQEEQVDALREHRTVPFAGRVSVGRSAPSWRAELHAGATNRSEVAVSFPTGDDPAFTQRERVGFAGALLEASPTDRLAVAVWGRLARADTDRSSTEAPAAGFALREETAAVGALQRFELGGPNVLEARIERLWRPEERSREVGASVDHDDRTTWASVGLVRRPTAGWTGRVAWALLSREAGELAPGLTATNHRLVTAGGWRFATGFEVTAGAGWDLDAFGRAPFDGGHVRFTGSW